MNTSQNASAALHGIQTRPRLDSHPTHHQFFWPCDSGVGCPGQLPTEWRLTVFNTRLVIPSLAAITFLLNLSHASALEGKSENVVNASSGYCLDTDGSAKNGAHARMWQCERHPNQTWTMNEIDADSYQLVNQSSGFCLDTDGSTANGALVRVWKCAKHPNQLWAPVKKSGNRYQLQNKTSGFCLDSDGSKVNGGKVQVWSCADHPNQTWSFR